MVFYLGVSVLRDSLILSLRTTSGHKNYKESLVRHDVLLYDHGVLSLIWLQSHTYSKAVNNFRDHIVTQDH